MKKFISVFLAAIICLFTFAAAGFAEAVPNPADLSILTLQLTADSEGQQIITGLTVSRTPLPAEQLTGLLRACTSNDAAFVTTDDTIRASTGLAVEWTVDGHADSALFVAAGDVLGTGELQIAQLTRMARALNGAEPLTGAFLAAADFDGNGLQIPDLVREAQLLAQGPAIDADAAAAVVDAAVALQTDGGTYHADVFHAVELHKGDIIYGMLPGQSAFYTDLSTVEACDGSYVAMYERLQMVPHPEFGYREQLGVYTVNEDAVVASGYCLANDTIDGTTAGPGGGVQFVIPEYEELLELTQTVDLHE